MKGCFVAGDADLEQTRSFKVNVGRTRALSTETIIFRNGKVGVEKLKMFRDEILVHAFCSNMVLWYVCDCTDNSGDQQDCSKG